MARPSSGILVLLALSCFVLPISCGRCVSNGSCVKLNQAVLDEGINSTGLNGTEKKSACDLLASSPSSFGETTSTCRVEWK